MTSPNVLSMPARIPGSAFIRAFFHFFPGVWFVYEGQTIVEVSANFLEQVGVSVSECVGTTAAEFGLSREVQDAITEVQETGAQRIMMVESRNAVWHTRLFPVEVGGKRYVGGSSLKVSQLPTPV